MSKRETKKKKKNLEEIEKNPTSTKLECENEPSPEVFQEAKIFSCVEAVVRVTDDIPLLNWIPHFAMKMRTGRRWKKSVAQLEKRRP